MMIKFFSIIFLLPYSIIDPKINLLRGKFYAFNKCTYEALVRNVQYAL